jgi:vitamin B12 transporter
LELGADGGNFSTAHGYGSVAGARGRFDFNIFGDQFNSNGEGINNAYSNSSEGVNVGIGVSDGIELRVRARHFNSSTGVSGEWRFNGEPLLAPDIDQHAHQNNLLGSVDLVISGHSHWQHRLTGFEYHGQRINQDNVPDRGCDVAAFNFFDCYFRDTANVNRAGFGYQGDYTPLAWAQTTLGYEFEDENGAFNTAFLTTDVNGNPMIGPDFTRGMRLNHALYAQQRVTRGRISIVGGARFIHNDSFGNRVVPRIAATVDVLRGGRWLSGTRLRGSYSTGIKEPRFEESFGISGIFPTNPNPSLKPEENRAFEAGIEQKMMDSRYAVSAVYFHNLFRDQIEFTSDPVTFIGQYINVNRSLARGVEVVLEGRPTSHVNFTTSYFYTSTRIEEAPLCTPAAFCDPIFFTGQPLLRRPKHAGNFIVKYVRRRWGADLAGSFVGRRPDSDFFGLGINHAAGYGRVDLGGWYAMNPRITVYANVANAFNKQYEEVVGYPALGTNFRAGLRFRIGGD